MHAQSQRCVDRECCAQRTETSRSNTSHTCGHPVGVFFALRGPEDERTLRPGDSWDSSEFPRSFPRRERKQAPQFGGIVVVPTYCTSPNCCLYSQCQRKGVYSTERRKGGGDDFRVYTGGEGRMRSRVFWILPILRSSSQLESIVVGGGKERKYGFWPS